jgi:hypothetical protein
MDLDNTSCSAEQSSYYEEISILVDGWPWNLSEFDFRRWFAPGACPRALHPVEIAKESEERLRSQKISYNRRVRGKQRKRDRKRKAA